MVYIILFCISAVSIYVFTIVGKKLKVPTVLFLLLLGILLGSYGLYDFFGQLDAINPNHSELAILATDAVIILFLVSGLSLNIEGIKKSGKKTVGLSIFPALIEGFIMGLIAYVILLILPFSEFHFSVFNFLMVMCVFAMSSPAIIIPINMKAKAEGKKEAIFDEMTVASVLDNFTPFPLLVLYIVMGLSIANGSKISLSLIIISLVSAIIGLIIAYVAGHLIGFLISKLFKVEFLNDYIISILLILATLVIVSILGPIGASYGIITGFGVGVGFNMGTAMNEKKKKINVNTSKLYGMFLMPLIFIYVGIQIRVDMLLQPLLIVGLVIITVLAIAIKGFVSYKYLIKTGSTENEAKLSQSLFAAKGIILINISLVISASYTSAGLENVLQYMYILAAVAILVSVPYSIMKSEKTLKKM